MVESRQEFDSENENVNRITDNQPDAEGSTYINTDAKYNNRINYGQPEQPYSNSVDPNMGAEIPQSNPHPTEKEKNNRLGRVLIGGLALGALGSLAAVLARRKLVQSPKHTTQVVEDAVIGVEKVNQAVKEGANAVQNKPESANQSVRSATDTSKYTMHSSNSLQTPENQYQERFNALNQRFSSEQNTEAKKTSLQVIYISPSSTRTKVNFSDDVRLQAEEINRNVE